MNKTQADYIKPILETWETEDIRIFAIALLNKLPDYIWHVPASSTGKYHPAYSLGEGGLMRHSIAVVRFVNYLFELEQFQNKFTARERDLVRTACLTHDGMKSGTQEEFEHNKYTKFNHPLLQAEVVRSFLGKDIIPDSEIEIIANAIESHMGQWNTDKRNKDIILPKPVNKYQQIVHMADYFASRKDLTLDFSSYKQELNLEEFTLTFGKYKGEKLVDLAEKDPSYVDWLKINCTDEYTKRHLELV